jgi:hypothetical protein
MISFGKMAFLINLIAISTTDVPVAQGEDGQSAEIMPEWQPPWN